MSDLSDCCYGMGFGPEGDGVELRHRARQAAMRDRADYWSKVMDACLPNQPGSFENIQWPQFTFETKEPDPLQAARDRVAKAGGPSLDELRERLGGWGVPEVSGTLKPSLPALTRQAGEKYKGLGFNDGMDQ